MTVELTEENHSGGEVTGVIVRGGSSFLWRRCDGLKKMGVFPLVMELLDTVKNCGKVAFEDIFWVNFNIFSMVFNKLGFMITV